MSEFWVKVDKTLQHHAKAVLIGLRGIWWDRRRLPAERPVFVVSCSRSGTQMLYKTLSLSQDIGSLNREIYAVWDQLHHPRDTGWDSHVLDVGDATPHDRDLISRYFFVHTGKRRFVDKNNQQGLAIPYLHALFPDATFVYIKRNPGDTLNSMIEAWGKPERFAGWSVDLPDTIMIDGGRYTRWCHFLPEGWRDYRHARIEEVCAYQFQAIHGAILKAREGIPRVQWIEVFYEDIIRDPVNSLRALFRSLGLEFDAALADHASQLLGKPYDPLFEIGLEKWRGHPHRRRIENVLPSLAGIAQAMGYSV